MAVLLTFLVVGVLVALVVAIYAASKGDDWLAWAGTVSKKVERLEGLGAYLTERIEVVEKGVGCSNGIYPFPFDGYLVDRVRLLEREFQPGPKSLPTLADRLAALEAKRGKK